MLMDNNQPDFNSALGKFQKPNTKQISNSKYPLTKSKPPVPGISPNFRCQTTKPRWWKQFA